MKNNAKTQGKINLEITGIPIEVIRGEDIILEVDFMDYVVKFKQYLDSKDGYVTEIHDFYPVYIQDTNGRRIFHGEVNDMLLEETTDKSIREKIIDHFAEEQVGEKFLVKFMDE